MEGCAAVALVLVLVLGPIILAILAFTKASSFRRRIEDLERFSEMRANQIRALTDRIKTLEAGRPPAAPPSATEPARVEPREEPVMIRSDLLATVFPPPPPKILGQPASAPMEEPKERVPLENLIGERILPRLGVVALVLGLGLLVWYSYTNLGPKGRLALAGSVGALMVAGGVILRRRPFTELLGGCLIGGGWAVVYITSYAAHFVPASQIVESRLLGFLILFGVSQAALVHALLYRNETITGLAYLLTIVSLFLSPEPGPPAWLAMGLSAATLVALAWRERWIRLCTFGAALLYVAEAVWLANTPPASIVPALAVLVALWLMWMLPDYFHRPATEWTKRIHWVLIALNFAGLLIVAALIQKWFALVYMGWVWLLLGGLYAVNAVVGRKAAWRTAYLAYLAFAAVLLAVGSHEQFSGLGPVIAWMGISAALFAWGLWRNEEIARLMGVAGAMATLLRFWILDRRFDYAFVPALALAGLIYAMPALISRLRRARSAGEIESSLVTPLSHIAAVALGLVIWHYPPDLMVAAVFAAAGLALIEFGPKVGAASLVPQGVCFLTVTVYFVASENLIAKGDVFGVSSRLASTIPVLLAWLYVRERYTSAEPAGGQLRGAFAVLLFSGVLALLGFELGEPYTPAAWAVACGTWFLWSRIARRDFEFVLAGLGAAATVLAYILVPSLLVPGLGWKGPVASGALIAGVFLAIHLASRIEPQGRLHALARDAFAGAMALTGFVLLAREMTGTWLTGTWAVLGFALAGYGFLVRDRVSRWSSLLVLGVCLGKVAIFDLATFDMPVKIATLLTLGGVMVALSFVYARHHRRIVVYLAGKE